MEANRYYWTHNLPAASPLYERAAKLFEEAHDDRNLLYAKVGLIRSQLQMPFEEISDFIAAQLKTPVVQNDPTLACGALASKATLTSSLTPARRGRTGNRLRLWPSSLVRKSGRTGPRASWVESAFWKATIRARAGWWAKHYLRRFAKGTWGLGPVLGDCG